MNKLVDGSPVEKTQSEKAAEHNQHLALVANNAGSELESLYQECKELTLSFIKDLELSVGTHSFNFFPESRQDFRDRRDAAKTSNSNRHFKTYSNDYVSFTPADYDTIFLALEAKGDAVFVAMQADKAAFGSSNYSLSNMNALKTTLDAELNALKEENA